VTRWKAEDVVRLGRGRAVKVGRGLVVQTRWRRGTKYGNHKTAGSDSNKEHRRLTELRLMERAGVIRELIVQPRIVLLPVQRDAKGRCVERQVVYVPDATYVDVKSGEYVVEDTKSEPTRKKEAYVLKRKMLLYLHGIRVREHL
jgi:hypothetical protein